MDWMDEAKQMAHECSEAFAEKLAFWMEVAAQNQRNCDYYRGLVVRCGEAIGKEAYIQDDGGVCDEVLCAKVPELVETLVRNIF